MEGHCSTGQSPQWAVVPVEEEEEVFRSGYFPKHCFLYILIQRVRDE